MASHFVSFSDFKELTKIRLSLSVVFSSFSGYLLASEVFSIKIALLVLFGGYCVVGASNVFNQIIERDLDKLMERTKNRPIPTGRVSPKQAFYIGLVLIVIGLVSLYYVNYKTAAFSAIGAFIYTGLYTPLKTRTPLAVFVGAISGAIPFMLGWVAATNDFSVEPGLLFMIQFFWQFPHFWAIAWMLDDDYKKAGFKMLPTGKKNTSALVQIISYTLWTMIVAVLPLTGLAGKLTWSVTSAVLITIMGGGMLFYGANLYRCRDNKAAGRLILASILYITLLQIVYVVDKWV